MAMPPALEDAGDDDDDQFANMTTEEILKACSNLNNEIRGLTDELKKMEHELKIDEAMVTMNRWRIKFLKKLPNLVATVAEILEMDPEEEEDGANVHSGFQRKRKCVVLNTTTSTMFLSFPELVDPDKLKPGDFVAVNITSCLILDTLPSDCISHVRAIEVDVRPTEDYTNIGGLDKQIEELHDAIVLPITRKDTFERIGIRPSKGVLLYGPPGTGKTLMARACAAQTDATFLRVAGPQFAKRYLGDGARLVREIFQLAKEKSPCIVFIDEIDAIGMKRFDGGHGCNGDVQRAMLELVNQIDGFSSHDQIKIIAATNRVDVLDPALMRSGRLDRKIEFPYPSEGARVQILKIHSRKMNVHPNVNFEELAHSTDGFNGAQLQAVCSEAGMLALRRDSTEIMHEDFKEGIIQVQQTKKASSDYYA